MTKIKNQSPLQPHIIILIDKYRRERDKIHLRLKDSLRRKIISKKISDPTEFGVFIKIDFLYDIYNSVDSKELEDINGYIL